MHHCAAVVPSVVSVHAAGGLAADQLFNWGRFIHHFWTAVVVVLCGAAYIVLGFFPYTDNYGHIFGMVAGFLLTVLMLRNHQMPIGERKRKQGAWRVTQVVAAALLVAMLVVGAVGLGKYHGAAGANSAGAAKFACISKPPHWTCEVSDSYVGPSCSFQTAANQTTSVTCLAVRWALAFCLPVYSTEGARRNAC